MTVRDTSDIQAIDLVTVSDTKAYLRVDHSDDDALIAALIEAAVEQIQHSTNTRIKTVNAYGYLEDFYNCTFPVGPVTAVTAVEYKASGDTYTALPSSKYRVALNSGVAKIRFDNYPSVDPDELERVRITFQYGYDDSIHFLPKQFKQAAMMLTAHLYDNRSPVATGQSVKQVPMSVEALISPFRIL